MRALVASIMLVALCLGTGCRKAYRVRVSNYYLSRLDSVVIGSHAVTFTAVDAGTTTDYRQITSGTHAVRFVTSDGLRFDALAPLEKNGGGDRTIQLDGLRQVNVLED